MGMKFGVVVFPGSNCEHDCYYLIQSVLGKPVEYIWHQNTSVQGFDAIVLPGGFAYGDYLRTGALAKFSPVMTAIGEFAQCREISEKTLDPDFERNPRIHRCWELRRL